MAILVAPVRRLALCSALLRASRAVQAARLQHTVHTAPADTVLKPLSEPPDPEERGLLAHAQKEPVHEDVYDQSQDFSLWRWSALAGGLAFLIIYQERCINDERYTIAGYDIDQAKTYYQDHERSALWRSFKGIFDAPPRPRDEHYARLGRLWKDELRHTDEWHAEHSYEHPRVRRIESNGAEMIERPFVLRIPANTPDNPAVTIDGLMLSKEEAWPNRPPSSAQQQGDADGENGDEASKDDNGDEGSDDS